VRHALPEPGPGAGAARSDDQSLSCSGSSAPYSCDVSVLWNLPPCREIEFVPRLQPRDPQSHLLDAGLHDRLRPDIADCLRQAPEAVADDNADVDRDSTSARSEFDRPAPAASEGEGVGLLASRCG
jgi:hypothetical protein